MQATDVKNKAIILKFRITELHSIRLTTMRRIIANLTPIVTVIIRLIQNGNAI